MANIFKYADKAAYTSATDRPAHESSVSFDGATLHHDAKNPLLPFSAANYAPVGCVVVKDGSSGAKFLIPGDKFDSAALDPSLKVMDVVLFGRLNGKALFIHKGNKSAQWAINHLYRITCDTTAAGGFGWSVVISGATKTGTVAWAAGDTIASIVAQINAVVSGIASDKTTFVGISISSYSNSDLVLSDNTGATLTDLSKYCKVDGVAQTETHRSFQATAVTSLFPSLGFTSASTVQYAKNGYNLSYVCGCNFTKFVAYYGTDGSGTYVAESSLNHMNRTAFAACGSSSVAEEKALYDKYNGSYEAYMDSRMFKIDDTHVVGVNWWSYDNGLEMTQKLASVTTMNLDGEYVPAYPAAYAAQQTFVSGDDDFAAGKFRMPTNTEIAMFMDADTLAAVNVAITKIGGTTLSITGYYWSVAEYRSDHAWFYNGYNGRLNNLIKYISYSVRSLLAFGL